MSQDGPASNDSVRRSWKARLTVMAGGIAAVTLCLAIRYFSGLETAKADPLQPIRPVGQQAAATPAPRASQTAVQPAARPTAYAVAPAAKPGGPEQKRSGPQIAAQINGVSILRDELAHDCLRRYGKEVLESMVNKHLIAGECQRANITITRAEVDAEIERMAQRFNLSVEQWLNMLKQERNIKPVQYANDIIWPMLALRKLAGDRLQVTQQDLRDAYEMHYGASVRCRLIACHDRATAEKVRAQAVAKPDQFGDLAKQHSEDSSASVKGVIPPIHKHGTFPAIENAAFAINDGQISPVIESGGQFLILKREALLPGAESVDFKRVAPQLEEVVREKKLRGVATDVFQRLQKDAHVENIFNDPVKSEAMPGVAATINGAPISLRELGDQCIERNGEEVLEGMISRKLIELDCQKRDVAITEQELDAEIARAASQALPLKSDGSPDVGAYVKMATEQQSLSVELFRSDSVWPAVALKRLIGPDIKITEEDLQKGYEANFGPRVKCRAIVLNTPRRAQEVWEMARRTPTTENFGTLAEQYSIEPGSQALRGEVPPIRKHGGQPVLEKEAFSLKPGELSGIVQVDDKYIILFCEGYTHPLDVAYQDVREEIYRDIFEKKQRMAMNEYFQHLHDSARIDNFLAGSSSSPTKATTAAATAGVPTLRQVSPQEARRSAPTVGVRAVPTPTR